MRNSEEAPGRIIVKLTNGDVKAIRQQLVSTPFVHMPRIALEWGIGVDRLKSIADLSAVLHHRQQQQ